MLPKMSRAVKTCVQGVTSHIYWIQQVLHLLLDSCLKNGWSCTRYITLCHLEDVLEVRVAEVGHDLGVRSSNSSGKSEGVNSPLQVAVPPVLLQWKPLTQCRLVNLHRQMLIIWHLCYITSGVKAYQLELRNQKGNPPDNSIFMKMYSFI